MRLLGWALIQYSWYPYKKGTLDTETTYTGRMPCQDKDRSLGDAPISQGMPRTASNPQKLERSIEQTLQGSPREEPTLLTPDFQSPDCERNRRLLLKPPSVWYFTVVLGNEDRPPLLPFWAPGVQRSWARNPKGGLRGRKGAASVPRQAGS